MAEIIICFLVCLYLVFSLSQEKFCIAWDHILAIINTFTHPKYNLEIVMAKDIRTILKNLKMNPNFTSYICCPKCYKLYLLENFQTQCLYKMTSQAPTCGQDLIKPQKLPQRGILPWFKPQMNGFLGFSLQNTLLEPVFNYQKSKGWKKTNPDKLKPNAQGSFLKLTLSLYIDFFDPFGNKISGRQASFGEPDMIKMSIILKPLFDKLLVLKKGVKLSNFKFPNGRNHPQGRRICFPCRKKILFFFFYVKSKISMNFALENYNMDEPPYLSRFDGGKPQQSMPEEIYSNHMVNNIVLGMMHNWYEVVLQNYFRIRWDFNAKTNKPDSSSANEDSNSDDLRDKNSTLTITEKANLQQLLPTVISPTGIASVPKCVGTASNGKLKASEWHSLLAKNLPLVALEAFGSAWSAGNSYQKLSLLNNLCSLIERTHLVESRLITEESCAKFDLNYNLYCRTLEPLFEGISIQPNHHYALHIGQLSQKFGPLIRLSEFRGERLNGMLQKLSTKNLLGNNFARCETDEVKERNWLIEVCSTT
ncbi:hypothetical protein VP01_923g6 [Puccinia sorghi]|uniref:Uncharacterized protein n=1 Tax=Puccinia sorghi TaxID=27349 RepID=A0A0L6U9C2_9BASI|nr:hypothetical protein VP01_923g6 [Puccinia sorghi]